MKKSSIILKLIVAVCSIWGICLCAFDPHAFMGGKAVWLYFTIQSNVWMALIALWGLVRPLLVRQPRPRLYSILQLAFTVSITLTGVVFCFVLAPTFGSNAFNLPNVLTHVIVPLAAVADFLLCGREYTFRTADCLYSALPALYYLGFASVGYVLRWPFGPGIHYPYFFLNWGSPAGAWGFCDGLPFMGVMYYVLIMLVSIIFVGWLYIRCAQIHKK